MLAHMDTIWTFKMLYVDYGNINFAYPAEKTKLLQNCVNFISNKSKNVIAFNLSNSAINIIHTLKEFRSLDNK